MVGFFLCFSCGSGKGTHNSDTDTTTGFVSSLVQEQDRYMLDGGVAFDSLNLESEAPPVERIIEESDIIKVEGTFLYILNRYRGLTICDVSTPDEPVIAGRVSVTGEPLEMYIRDGVAYVMASQSMGCVFEDGAFLPQENSTPSSVLYAVSVADPEHPEIISSIDIDGRITDSRIVGSILYTVTTEDTYSPENGYAGNTMISSFDISDNSDMHPVDQEDVSQSARYIHVTDHAIFTASEQGYFRDSQSTITYIDISDAGGQIVPRGAINVTGSIADKFKLDYYNGYLRVCAYDWSQRHSNVFTIRTANPDALEISGQLAIGKGESLFATRFDGTRAYMVTFMRVDPLWVIDLSNPEKPVVAGELEVPGWSTHIEARGNRLVALGVDNSPGSRKVSVSLFDVEHPNSPLLIKRVSFGEENGWTWTEGYSDYRAFSLLDEMGLILLPFSTYVQTDYHYENRLQLIDYSDDNLVPRGWVTQQGNILRSGTLSDRLFAVSDDEVQVINAEDRDHPVVSAVLPLAENVRKFVPLDNGYGVIVIDKVDGTTGLRAVTMSGDELAGASELSLGRFCSDVIGDGNRVIVISTHNNDVYINALKPINGSALTCVDFTIPEKPEKKGSIDIPGQYYSEYDVHGAHDLYSWYSNHVFHLNEHVHLFQCQSSPYIYFDFESTFAPVNGFHGLITVDFKNEDKPKILSQTDIKKDIWNLFTKNSVVYYSYYMNLSEENSDPGRVRYNLGRIDMTDPENPVEQKPINIPGICMDLNDNGSVAYTCDYQPAFGGVLTPFFYTVELSDDHATLLDKIQLDKNPGRFSVGSNRVYFQPSWNWYHALGDINTLEATTEFCQPWYPMGNTVYTLDVETPKTIRLYKNDFGGNGCYLSISGAINKKLIINTQDMLTVFDTSDPGSFGLSGQLPIQGWLCHVAITDSSVVASMGYGGINVLTDPVDSL